MPLYQNKVKCSAFDMEMIFHSHANKTHFHKKGCALGLSLKVACCNRHAGCHYCGLYKIIGTLFPPLLNENGSFCYRMLWDVPFCIYTTHKDGWICTVKFLSASLKPLSKGSKFCWLLWRNNLNTPIDLFTLFFSTFDMDKLGRIRRHHWKEHLKINNIA